MGRAVTSITIDDDLRAKIQDKGINLSDLVEETIRQRLNIDLSLDEINEKETILLSELDSLERQKNIILEKEMAAAKALTVKAQAEEEQRAEQRKDRITFMRSVYNMVPELSKLTAEELNNNKMLMEIVDRIRVTRPEVPKFGVMDIKKYHNLIVDCSNSL